MSKYDLISFDMDGTLLNSRKNISPKTSEAIDKAISAGKTVILATGRAPSELLDYKRELKSIRYYICSSGAVLFDSFKEHIVFSKSIPKDTVLKILDAVAQIDAMIYISSNGQHMFNYRDSLNMEHFLLGQYKDQMLRTAVLHEDIAAAYRKDPFPVEKLNLYCASAEIRDSINNLLSPLPITRAYTEESFLEMSPPNISKAFGLQELCRQLSIPIEKTIAVGDSDNDAEILKIAGLSVAMDNAFSPIKDLCDVTVADNDHDGCAEAIEKYLFGSP